MPNLSASESNIRNLKYSPASTAAAPVSRSGLESSGEILIYLNGKKRIDFYLGKKMFYFNIYRFVEIFFF